MSKVALITGVTGQDGAYLSAFLLNKGYEVHGVKRRSSLINTVRIDHLYQDPHEANARFRLHYGDLTDGPNLIHIIQKIQPDEIYNLGAMSHVKVSFDMPEYTANVNGMGTLRLLEAIRFLGMQEKTKMYQASTSELFGTGQAVAQNETTFFYPRTPYAVAKLYAYWITVNYREAYNMFAANGILFNHESPLRGETFVTRKITRAIAQLALGLSDVLYIGNLDAQRDWGHAKDYVEAMWLILQQPEPDDYIIATGISTSVREFVRLAFEEVGVEIGFYGYGLDEIGIVQYCTNQYTFTKGQEIVKIDPHYFRPTEHQAEGNGGVQNLSFGDATKAKQKLGWSPKYSLKQLIAEMIAFDLSLFKKTTLTNLYTKARK